MTKIKIFQGKDFDEIEEMVNSWVSTENVRMEKFHTILSMDTPIVILEYVKLYGEERPKQNERSEF